MRDKPCVWMWCGGLVTRSQLLSCRSGKLTPSQVAKNIIATLEDCDKSTPPLRAIVQWDQEQIMLVMSASGRKGASAIPRAVASIRRGRRSSADILHRKICIFFSPSLCRELQTSLLSFLQREVALKQSVSCWMTMIKMGLLCLCGIR